MYLWNRLRPGGMPVSPTETDASVFFRSMQNAYHFSPYHIARSGDVKEGDIITMCSATFGDDMWSTRGVGLTRVLAAIRVRAGGTVKLVLESPAESKKKRTVTTAQIKAQEEARIAAQKKKDQLLDQLEQDEVKLTGGKKFFGLF